MRTDIPAEAVEAAADELTGWIMTGEYDSDATMHERAVDCARDTLAAALPYLHEQWLREINDDIRLQ